MKNDFEIIEEEIVDEIEIIFTPIFCDAAEEEILILNES